MFYVNLAIKSLSTLACVDVEMFCLISLIKCLLIKAGLSRALGLGNVVKTMNYVTKG